MAYLNTPIATMFATNVNVPVEVIQIEGKFNSCKDISEIESRFTELTNNAPEKSLEKRDYDLCRATIKWANTCNAYLESISMHIGDKRAVCFMLFFADLDDMVDFVNNLSTNVSSAVA